MQRHQQENLHEKFSMEDYEKYPTHLSKVTKGNLMRHAKHSNSKDPKILDTSKKTSTFLSFRNR